MKSVEFDRELNKIEKGECPICGEVIVMEDFKDELSIKEFTISGMCQKCQDSIFI